MKTPVAVFAYRRPEHLARCLAALERCARLDECEVTIFCDGPRSEAEREGVEAVRTVAHAWRAAHPVTVREAAQNLGLARSVVSGVSELCGAHGRVVVIEDDLEVAPDFLAWMLAALERYEDEPRVMQVSGYRLPFAGQGKGDAFFLPCTTTWGWATWSRAWAQFRWQPEGIAALEDPAVAEAFDLGGAYPYAQMLQQRLAGGNDSWGILWWWVVFRAQGAVLYPQESLVTVGGFDGSGTHCGTGAGFVRDQVAGSFSEAAFRWPEAVHIDEEALSALRAWLRERTEPWWKRALEKILPA